jgi:hypothetical protein
MIRPGEGRPRRRPFLRRFVNNKPFPVHACSRHPEWTSTQILCQVAMTLTLRQFQLCVRGATGVGTAFENRAPSGAIARPCRSAVASNAEHAAIAEKLPVPLGAVAREDPPHKPRTPPRNLPRPHNHQNPGMNRPKQAHDMRVPYWIWQDAAYRCRHARSAISMKETWYCTIRWRVPGEITPPASGQSR